MKVSLPAGISFKILFARSLFAIIILSYLSHVNMTNLVDGTYNYTVWAENTAGGWSQTGRRFVTVR